jgi:hypothetical protein
VLIVSFGERWLIDGNNLASFAAGLNDRRVTTERRSRSSGGLHAVSAAAAHHLARRAVPLEEFANALYERVRLR